MFVFVFVFSNMCFYICPTHRHKDKVVTLFAEEGAGQGKKQEDNVDEDHLKKENPKENSKENLKENPPSRLYDHWKGS